MLRRDRQAALLRSASIGIASALTFFVLAQSDTLRAQVQVLSVGGVDAAALERATISLTMVALIVGALQVGVVMTRVVLRRMGEIGVMKAAGIPNRNIFAVFSIEALLYGVLGGVLGCVLGGLLLAFGPAPDLAATVRAAGITLGLSAVIAFLAGIAPAIRAMRSPTVEAISYAW
jgi:putative ABC transport system permease protein